MKDFNFSPTSSSDILISLDDVGVKYKIRGGIFKKAVYHQALNSISFDLRKGETIGVVGPNGAGKSTLLRVLAGIYQPDTGTIVNTGVSVSLLALQAGFDKSLSGYDNIVLNGMLLGYSRKEAITSIPNIRNFSGLENFLDRPVRTYSTGMRSRLGFTIALFLSPDVLLLDEVLDEVLSVSDKDFKAKARAAMEKKISSIQSVVMVSHNENDISKFCDRVITLSSPDTLHKKTIVK